MENRSSWHMRKTVQTLQGPLFVAGKSKKCVNPACAHRGMHYYATGVLTISLPNSTYGLDVLAYIGWQHEHEHRQLVEIHRALNEQGVEINERNVGKLYRQYLALVGAMSEQTAQNLEQTALEHGGLMWAIDALQPEGNGGLLYVLYEALSGTAVSAIQLASGTEARLSEWLKAYRELPMKVLATLCDGENAIIAALKKSWPDAPLQRCQLHFLNNLAEAVLKVDTQLRSFIYDDLGELPAVPTEPERAPSSTVTLPPQPETPPREAELIALDLYDDLGDSPVRPMPPESVPSPAVAVSPQPDTLARDPELVAIEAQFRIAIRDALHHKSRKPFHWAGLVGYQQLEAAANALATLPQDEPETAYLHRIATQVSRAVEKNRTLANDLKLAHQQLKRVATCLRYPSASPDTTLVDDDHPPAQPTSQDVAKEMKALIADFQPNHKRQKAQSALHRALHRTWNSFGADLLHTYDIPGLPADNLQMEALFGHLRRHQRRISGRKSTAELRNFGHCQVLLRAESQQDLLQQMQHVPSDAYLQHRQRLADAEKPRQLLYRLHRNPTHAFDKLLAQHNNRRHELLHESNTALQGKPTSHLDNPSARTPLSTYGNLKRAVPAFIRKWLAIPTPDDELPDALSP
ncbi:MAG: transposase [Gammaproteobacteria bacterium]|nr:transposase [Gammaproteobacteria bacterium]